MALSTNRSAGRPLTFLLSRPQGLARECPAVPGRLVWAKAGRSEATVEAFFDALVTNVQAESREVVEVEGHRS